MNLPKLDIYKFTFRLKVIDRLNVPEYMGSVIRGAFGYAFRKVACITRLKECDDCMIKETCSYFNIFETEMPDNNIPYLRGVKKIPHPFVLHPPEDSLRSYAEGEEMDIGVTLIGNGIKYFPFFIYTFVKMGEFGMGKGRGHFELDEVFSLSQSGRKTKIYDKKTGKLKTTYKPINIKKLLSAFPARPKKITLNFTTPFRYQHESNVLRNPHQLDISRMLGNIEKRIYTLAVLYGENEMPELTKPEFGEIKIAGNNLKYYDWERYSSRQDKIFSLGGFTGKLTLTGDLSKALPLLVIGSRINVGKNTVFGLGKYTLSAE